MSDALPPWASTLGTWPLLAVALLLRVTSPALAQAPPAAFTIAQLHYHGGGDWYANPSSLPNLLAFLREHTRIAAAEEPARVQIMDEELFTYPYIYMTGHGNVSFSPEEVVRLRQYLEGGGFLHADDNYGMDQSFRLQISRVFPEKALVELPPEHGIFHCHFDFPQGIPKIHEHDGKRPQALGIFHGERLAVLYTYETDLGDGWEDEQVHSDPPEKRRAALEMGTNIVVWALTH
ncbi:MAG: DUF4159 domain-containing protein [Candidatus Latescibacterota bacterium]